MSLQYTISKALQVSLGCHHMAVTNQRNQTTKAWVTTVLYLGIFWERCKREICSETTEVIPLSLHEITMKKFCMNDSRKNAHERHEATFTKPCAINHPEVPHTHEESSKTNELIIHPSTNWLGQNRGSWGSGTFASPMGGTFGPKFNIYVEIICCEHFVLIGKKCL